MREALAAAPLRPPRSPRCIAPRGRRGAGRSGAVVEAAGEDRGGQRFRVHLARRGDVEWLKPFGCVEQQRRTVAAPPERERQLSAEAGELKALEIAQRARLCNCK